MNDQSLPSWMNTYAVHKSLLSHNFTPGETQTNLCLWTIITNFLFVSIFVTFSWANFVHMVLGSVIFIKLLVLPHDFHIVRPKVLKRNRKNTTNWSIVCLNRTVTWWSCDYSGDTRESLKFVNTCTFKLNFVTLLSKLGLIRAMVRIKKR